MGIQSWKAGRYGDSAAAFQKAVDLHSGDAVPYLYLGLAWSQQYFPGGSDPSNAELAIRAEEEFRRAVDLDGANWPALVLLGQLAFNEGKFDEARIWYRKALDLDPSNANTWCMLGAIAWRDLRANYAIRPDYMPGRPPKAPVRRQFRTGSDLVIAEGTSHLQRALALDPLHDGAMAFLDTLIGERADLRTTPEESREDMALADEWRRKSDDAKMEKQRMAASGVVSSWPPEFAGTFQLLHDMASYAVRSLPPPRRPPPPPPRDPSGQRAVSRTATPRWVFRHIHRENETPPPMLVNPAALGRGLITRVDPVSSVPGSARLDVVIGKDGRVRTAKVVSGDSPFAEAAADAVRQWIYRPTLSNWEAVEVRSEVVVKSTPHS